MNKLLRFSVYHFILLVSGLFAYSHTAFWCKLAWFSLFVGNVWDFSQTKACR